MFSWCPQKKKKHTHFRMLWVLIIMCRAIICWMSMQCREHTCTGIVILCQNRRLYTMTYYLTNFSSSPEGRRGWAVWGKSWAFTVQLSLQCNIFSRAVVEGKSLSPLFYIQCGGGGCQGGKVNPAIPFARGWGQFCLCWGFTALFIQWGHIECSQFT